MDRILGIGNATVDIVHSLPEYPAENDEVRCNSRVLSRGGNAANTLVVLAGLGYRCSWAGMLSNDADGRFVQQDLVSNGVDTRHGRVSPRGAMPVSTVILSAATGSRTIVHYRDLPEYGLVEFGGIALDTFDWLHFEGRNTTALAGMLEQVRSRYPAMPVSLEVEKPREGIEDLFGQVDVLLFSRDYARHHGYDEPGALLRDISPSHTAADMFCTWGAAGAVARDRAGAEYSQPAVAAGPVVDTLGAGDVFNAGVISGYLRGRDMPGILRCACTLAGRKCMQHGLHGLTGED